MSPKQQLSYRMLEGITSLFMPIGFFTGGGGRLSSSLSLFYIMHTAASFCFHLFPSHNTLWLENSLLNLLIMERLYRKNHNLWAYPLYMMSFVYEKTDTIGGAMARLIIAIISTLPSVYDICMWIICFLTLIQSMNYRWKNDPFKTALTCCLYHVYMSILSHMEVRYYDTNPHHHGILGQVFRYCTYLFLVAYAVVIQKKITNPRRLRSVLSLVSFIIMSPLSIYQVWKQAHTPFTLQQNPSQSPILAFYIAYCVVDLLVGYFYYPHHLEIGGHLWTTLFAIHFLRKDKMFYFCLDLALRSPVILLDVSRVFYDAQWSQTLRRIYFDNLFLWSRVILPTLFMMYFYKICMEDDCIIMYCLNLMLGSQWFYLQVVQ